LLGPRDMEVVRDMRRRWHGWLAGALVALALTMVASPAQADHDLISREAQVLDDSETLVLSPEATGNGAVLLAALVATVVVLVIAVVMYRRSHDY
jgi:Na+/proline symporter